MSTAPPNGPEELPGTHQAPKAGPAPAPEADAPTDPAPETPRAQADGGATAPPSAPPAATPTHRAPRPIPGVTAPTPTEDMSDQTPTRADVPVEPFATRSLPPSDPEGGVRDEQPTVAIPIGTSGAPMVAGPGAEQRTEPDPSARVYDPPAPAQQPAADEGILPPPLPEEPASRAAAHWWGVLIALVLTPVAWFLISDGSARIYWSLWNDPSSINRAGILGLTAGLAVLSVVLLAARWSSVGPIIAGSIALLGGVAFLAFPARALDTITSWQETFERFGGFGSNVYLYLVESGMRGQLVVGGVVLMFVGIVSHGARRLGRSRERDRLAARASRGEDPFV